MALQKLVGTDLDLISQSISKIPAYKVLLFDPYQDTFSDVVLDRYSQVPIDITAFVSEIQLSISHDSESNQCSMTVAADRLDYRLLMFAWVKVYEGDLRVDRENWPCVFCGVFQGQPSLGYERGTKSYFKNTAYDRSIFFRNKKITSNKVWLPEDYGVNLGEICVEIATNTEWGMGLDRQEVLFGKFYRSNGTEWRVNKKLQIVDTPPMEALATILQVVRRVPAFNGEGKLVAREVNLDKVPVRIYADKVLIQKLDIPQNNMDLPSSVKVVGLDYRLTKLEYPEQKMMTCGPIPVGMFDPHIEWDETWSDDNSCRVTPVSQGRNQVWQGTLLATIWSFGSDRSVTITAKSEFACHIDVYIEGATYALIVCTTMIITYIALRIVADMIGSIHWLFAALAFALDITATILLLLVLETMRSLGTLTFEVWGTPYEYVYREIEAKALLSDTLREEDSPEEITNHILGTLEDCEDLARDALRQKVAEIAARNITLSTDLLLEPTDVLEMEEDGETARFYVQEVSKNFSRGAAPTYDLNAYRIK